MQIFKNRIFVETQYLGANVGCVSTKKGLVLIDSPLLPKDARDWAGKIRDATGQDIAYLINTDHHFDHIMGNSFLTDRVVCHSAAARGMKFFRDKKEELKKAVQGTFPRVLRDFEAEIDALEITSPHITFQKKLTLYLDDITLLLEFVGGHSPATILIHLPEDRLVFTGDNVETQFPFFLQGRFHAWKEVLQKIFSMDIELVVPGHGPVGGKELIEKYLTFFQNMEEEVKDFGLKGFTIEQMIGRSGMIDFFKDSGTADGGLPRSWLEAQYRSAAKQILNHVTVHGFTGSEVQG